MVLIGLDYGTKHMGVSVGDTISKQAQPLSGFSYVNDGWFEPLQSIVEQWQPEKIVIGLPLNADGSRQPLTDQVLTFVKVLEEKIGLPVVCVDERWSTVAAKANIYAAHKTHQVKKSMVDAESAKLILEQWLLENT